ncbi:hypothetical protein AC1031_011388 [Aphanomyces cochlioides]|nr:hypothetical protein AC1031_011388 [Aphanomyces cochlioides]
MPCTRTMPPEILVKVAFFIPEWSFVQAFLEALRPIQDLGPLEHLWQLHVLGWKANELWPRLDLTKMTAVSQDHIEAIAKYYSEVGVNVSTNLDWFRQFVGHMTSIHWMGRELLPHVLVEWKDLRITWIIITSIYFDKHFIEGLSYLNYLEVFRGHGMTPFRTEAMLKYAASSSSLRHLYLRTSDRRYFGDRHCALTMSMAKDLIQWITTQLVRVLELYSFSWKDSNLRKEVMTAVLACETIEKFGISEYDCADFSVTAKYHRLTRQTHLDFYDFGRKRYHTVDLNHVHDFIYHFGLFFLETDELVLSQPHVTEFDVLWENLAPVLQQAQLKVLKFEKFFCSEDEASEMAEGLHCHPTLETLVLDDECHVPYSGVVVLLSNAPATLKNLLTSLMDFMVRRGHL